MKIEIKSFHILPDMSQILFKCHYIYNMPSFKICKLQLFTYIDFNIHLKLAKLNSFDFESILCTVNSIPYCWMFVVAFIIILLFWFSLAVQYICFFVFSAICFIFFFKSDNIYYMSMLLGDFTVFIHLINAFYLS